MRGLCGCHTLEMKLYNGDVIRRMLQTIRWTLPSKIISHANLPRLTFTSPKGHFKGIRMPLGVSLGFGAVWIGFCQYEWFEVTRRRAVTNYLLFHDRPVWMRILHVSGSFNLIMASTVNADRCFFFSDGPRVNVYRLLVDEDLSDVEVVEWAVEEVDERAEDTWHDRIGRHLKGQRGVYGSL